jgi:tetratricopeptide (TPR) repeat protein
MINVNALRERHNVRLDEPLEIWRRFRSSGRLANASEMPDELADMARSVHHLFGWTDDDARRAKPTGHTGTAASAGGPAGLYMLAEKAGQSAVDFGEASRLARELAVGDDDIMFLLVFAAKSKFGDGQTSGAMMQLAAMIMQDDATAGKLYRTLAALGSDRSYQMMVYESADKRLSGGANDALRAEVWNEVALLYLAAGRFDEARNKANAARALAVKSGAGTIASMALGNLAFILMQERKFGEALRAFEQLAKDQEAAADSANLEITRQNIAICRRYLRGS